jgi:hypothetical protein
MRRLADVVFDEHLSDEQLPAALQRLEATVKLMRDHHDVIRANKKK